MAMYDIYRVKKYQGAGGSWLVVHCLDPIEFRCSCKKMELVGLPCDHILAVLVFLDSNKLPKCLVLDRWIRFAKESIAEGSWRVHFFRDSQSLGRFSTPNHW